MLVAAQEKAVFIVVKDEPDKKQQETILPSVQVTLLETGSPLETLVPSPEETVDETRNADVSVGPVDASADQQEGLQDEAEVQTTIPSFVASDIIQTITPSEGNTWNTCIDDSDCPVPPCDVEPCDMIICLDGECVAAGEGCGSSLCGVRSNP
jgi:hypothetical protein